MARLFASCYPLLWQTTILCIDLLIHLVFSSISARSLATLDALEMADVACRRGKRGTGGSQKDGLCGLLGFGDLRTAPVTWLYQNHSGEALGRFGKILSTSILGRWVMWKKKETSFRGGLKRQPNWSFGLQGGANGQGKPFG